jgi:short-subunit dehydrogenase
MTGISYEGFGDKVPTPAGIRKIFDHTLSVNITSTHAITHAFAPLILKSSQPRILFVTSGLASLDACAEARIHVIAEPAPKGW